MRLVVDFVDGLVCLLCCVRKRGRGAVAIYAGVHWVEFLEVDLTSRRAYRLNLVAESLFAGPDHRPLSYLSLKSHYGSPHDPHITANVTASESSTSSFPTSPNMLSLVNPTAPHRPHQRMLLLHQPTYLLTNSTRLAPSCSHPLRFFFLLSFCFSFFFTFFPHAHHREPPLHHPAELKQLRPPPNKPDALAPFVPRAPTVEC